jgi:antitoxin component YwqK of YwqJK toxin-antitoxin module
MKSLKINPIQRISLGILTLLLAFSHAYSQVPNGIYPNKTDEKGRKQGAWKKLDERGTCVYVGQFKDDKPYGLFTYFDTEGRKMSEMNFFQDGAIAYGKMYFTNGFVQAQGKYVNQQKDSLWKFYSELNGLLLSEETYVKGKKEGKSIVYHPGTSQVASVTIFKNGVEEGPYYEYYLDGSKTQESTYIAGNLEGKATWYFSDGRINIIGNYQHAVKHGTWVYYNADGTVKGKEVWEFGKLKSGEAVIKPEDIKEDIQQEPGYDGKDPNEGTGPR